MTTEQPHNKSFKRTAAPIVSKLMLSRTAAA
jgi:hypothetical protein